MDLGFSRGGFDVVWANDIDVNACKTYETLVGDHVECGDVLRSEPPQEADVVIGGPPCQGFSVIGRMDHSDPRSQHVFRFLDVVRDVGARAFVMENVKSLAENPRWEGTRDALRRRARELGFETEIFTLNASDYGVPQSRQRMFFIGIKGQTPTRPPIPKLTSPPTVRGAIARLPGYGEPGNDAVVKARIVPAREPIMRPTPFKGSLLFNGSGRPLDLDAPAKTLPASMGGNATPIIDQLALQEGAEPWVVAYHQRLKEGKRPLKRAPKRLRRITVQEAAALQTFPLGTEFAGPQVSQLRQIGNAVPPMLAEAVAKSLKYQLGLAVEQQTAELQAA